MKKDDFERIKAVCEKEGFDWEYAPKSLTGLELGILITKKKDPWEGVEFASNGLEINKIKEIDRSCVYWASGGFNYIADCKPSTEEAYVDQLKKEALERFGEIKEGDRFELSNGIPNKYVIGYFFKPVWNYCKESDKLSFSGYTLYEAGKWAERVNKRIEVTYSGASCKPHPMRKDMDIHEVRFYVNHTNGLPTGNAFDFLSSQLEKYLNGEIK